MEKSEEQRASSHTSDTTSEVFPHLSLSLPSHSQMEFIPWEACTVRRHEEVDEREEIKT